MANPQVILTLSAEDNLTATLQRAQDEMRSMAQSNKELQSQLSKFKAANDKANTSLNQGQSSLRGYRSGMAQVGYQLQDIAVQIQGGQNLGIILGQQGSQIASVFGPGGVVAGAIISIGALIGTALIPKLFEADKSIEALVDDTIRYTDNLRFATEEQTKFVQSFKTEQLDEKKQKLSELTTQLDNMAKAQEALNRINAEFAAGKSSDTAIAQAEMLEKVLKDQNTTLIEQQALMSELGLSQNKAAETFMQTNLENDQKLQQEAWDRYQARIKKQKTADEKAAQDKIDVEVMLQKTFADIEAKRTEDAKVAGLERVANEEMIYSLFAGIREKERADIQAQDEWFRQQLQKQLQADVDYYMKVRELSDATVGNISSAAGALAANLKEGTRAQQAAMAIQKGLAVGQAIMNMHVAISEANKLPFPANISLVARAAATGLSAIAGVQAVSFEGGGYTGSGIRAGGLDGIGGMPAILHPNETVIDHTKGGSSKAVTVNLNIHANDTAGFDKLLQDRRGLIVSMINQAVNNRGRVSIA